ncbi:hypothetical protein BDV95DRAFT_593919 [Massariosphaeria phaeospora]|uniref:Uncharacterized protein n=1 Tax=Massariosphaeria phaeospora TaxID=100035 RepID=A0A7C8IF32_9PLEO|nr:hypothetical protein BDV95DRAFT_593919 [Massariosphaeria phaeospora]
MNKGIQIIIPHSPVTSITHPSTHPPSQNLTLATNKKDDKNEENVEHPVNANAEITRDICGKRENKICEIRPFETPPIFVIRECTPVFLCADEGGCGVLGK